MASKELIDLISKLIYSPIEQEFESTKSFLGDSIDITTQNATFLDNCFFTITITEKSLKHLGFEVKIMPTSVGGHVTISMKSNIPEIMEDFSILEVDADKLAENSEKLKLKVRNKINEFLISAINYYNKGKEERVKALSIVEECLAADNKVNNYHVTNFQKAYWNIEINGPSKIKSIELAPMGPTVPDCIFVRQAQSMKNKFIEPRMIGTDLEEIKEWVTEVLNNWS